MLTTPTEETWPGVTSFPDYKAHFPTWTECMLEETLNGKLPPAAVDLLKVRGAFFRNHSFSLKIDDQWKLTCFITWCPFNVRVSGSGIRFGSGWRARCLLLNTKYMVSNAVLVAKSKTKGWNSSYVYYYTIYFRGFALTESILGGAEKVNSNWKGVKEDQRISIYFKHYFVISRKSSSRAFSFRPHWCTTRSTGSQRGRPASTRISTISTKPRFLRPSKNNYRAIRWWCVLFIVECWITWFHRNLSFVGHPVTDEYWEAVELIEKLLKYC